MTDDERMHHVHEVLDALPPWDGGDAGNTAGDAVIIMQYIEENEFADPQGAPTTDAELAGFGLTHDDALAWYRCVKAQRGFYGQVPANSDPRCPVCGANI